MTTADHVIMVVSSVASDAENLRSQIEFMDSANVITAMPDEWRARLGEARLEVLFVGQDLSAKDVESLLGEVGQMDPNVPIVMLDSAAET